MFGGAGPAQKTELELSIERGASLPQIPTNEATALAFVNELEQADSQAAVEAIAARIEESVFLSYEVEHKIHLLQQFFNAKHRLKLGYYGPGNAAITKMDEDCKAYLAAEVHRAFQPAPPAPASNPVLLTFVDVTAQHKDFASDDIWVPEAVEASMDEPFDDAFYRFRALANPKYRHPYLPTVAFHVSRSGSLVRIGQSGDGLTVAAHLETQDGSKEIAYIHSDDDHYTTQAAWSHCPQLRKLSILQRVLPSGFSAPSHWLDPAPPPSSSLPTRPEVFWHPVPTLVMPTNARLPLPSTTTIYLPVRVWPHDPEPSALVSIEQQDDVCLPADRLVPPLTVEQATSLLGRMVQWSDLEPGQEKWRTKFQSRELGYAWGLDPEGMKLYCLTRYGMSGSAYVVDLSETAQQTHDFTRPRADGGQTKEYYASPPWGLRSRVVQWVGIVSLPGDRDARKIKTGGSVDKQRKKEQEKAAYQGFLDRMKAAIDALNKSPESARFEIGKDGVLLVGDIASCTQLSDFTFVKSLRPGIWRSAFTFKPQDGGPDGGNVKSVRLWFIREGSVDYAKLDKLKPGPESDPAKDLATPSTSGESAVALDGASPKPGPEPEQPSKPWEKLDTLSVDAGTCALLSKSVLSKGGFLRSKLVDLELVLETLADGGENELYMGAKAVPGGIVCPSGPGDGGYHVLGKRDGEGKVREVMIDFWEDVLKAQAAAAGDAEAEVEA